LETKDALPKEELAVLLRESYGLVLAKLPRKTREALLPPRRQRTKRKPISRKPRKTS
jgi:hypothetical protein